MYWLFYFYRLNECVFVSLLKKMKNILVFFIAFWAVNGQAQISNKISKRNELSTKTSVLGKFNFRNGVFYTKYSSDFKTAWQHGISSTLNNSTTSVNINYFPNKPDNIQQLPKSYRFNNFHSNSILYHVVRLKNVRLNKDFWFSSGPGIGLAFDAYRNSISYNLISTFTVDSFLILDAKKSWTSTNGLSFNLYYCASLKYALADQFVVGINLEYMASIRAYKSTFTNGEVRWDSNSFVSMSNRISHSQAANYSMSIVPVSSFSISYFFK